MNGWLGLNVFEFLFGVITEGRGFLPSREQVHIIPGEKEDHRLKSTL